MEKEDQVTSGKPERKATKGQIALIRGYKIFAGVLTKDLRTQPELTDELSTLVHNPKLAYRDILKHFLNESGRSLTAVVRGPFVKAMEATPQCSEDERAFLFRVGREADIGSMTQTDTLTEFQEWVGTRIPFMTRGLQYFVRHEGVIDPLAPAEARSKTLVVMLFGEKLTLRAGMRFIGKVSKQLK